MMTRRQLFYAAGGALLFAGCSRHDPRAVRIGSTADTGNTAIAEIYASALQAKGVIVEREMRIGDARAMMNA
jgi:glycine betaine/choline ABC-type transport system substrate-binding protein